MSKMDRSRQASKARDQARDAADPLPLSGGKFSLGNPMCLDCKDSLAYLTWNAARQLWEHHRCGATFTIDEV